MRKSSKFASQFLYPPMEVGRFVNPPAAGSAGETTLFRAKATRRLLREQCWECDGTGKVTIYPLVEVTCHACKGRGYFLELHIGFEKPGEN